jgi:L-fucose isomerase-like protein
MEFKLDFTAFLGVCRVVKGLKHVRVGAIGARPAAFNTVRYSEKILENFGISVETVDLSEITGRAAKLSDTDPAVREKLNQIQGYCTVGNIAEQHLLKMAKLGLVIDRFQADNELDICAIQCWTSLEEFYGVVPCTLMSMMSNSLKPSACEVDVTGALGMYAMQLASGTPSAILDWNNNYGEDPDKCVVFHCSNIPKHFINNLKMDYQEIIAGSVGKDNTWGTVVGRIKTGPMTYCRFATDDELGTIRTYYGEGAFTDSPIDTFGGYGVVHVDNLQELLRYICVEGFEHHVAASLSECADILNEAFTTYLGYDNYYHF